MDAINPFSSHPHSTGAAAPAWALVPGEDAAAYRHLHTQLFEALQPADALERMWFEDVVALVWERRRLAGLRAHILTRDRKWALWRLLGRGLKLDATAGRRLMRLIERALAGDATALSHIEHSLERQGYTLSAVLSEAYDDNLDELQQVDALIAGCERRRDKLLREIERRRASYASRLRAAALKAQTAQEAA